MSLIRRTQSEPTSALSRQAFDPFEVMNQMLRWDPFRDVAGTTWAAPTFSPALDVRETKDAYVFKADLPGVKEEDLDVSVAGNRVTVSGQRTTERNEETETWYLSERTAGSFTRTFTLPEGADADQADAELKHGVLSIVVPKKAEAKPRKLSLKGLFGKGSDSKSNA